MARSATRPPITRKPHRCQADEDLVARFICHANPPHVLQSLWRGLDKAFQVSMPGDEARTFDSFECAIHALAPPCEYCGVKVIGHGVEADGHFYCCAHCASMAGMEGVSDRS